MKDIFLNKYMNIIINNNPDFSLEKLEKIKYGIEGIYLTITKLIVVIILGFLLGILKDIVLLLFFYNILRFFGFGYHAKNSRECLIFSILFFVILPLLITKKIIIIKYKFFIILLCLINFILFAPSDTKKRPMFNKKKKLKRKIILVFLTLLYSYLSFIISESFSNALLQSLIIQSIMCNPVIYWLTNEPYNNYKIQKMD